MLAVFTPFLMSMLRHAFTSLAGILVRDGLLKGDQTQTFVAACMLFSGIGMAAWHKINQPETLALLNARVQARQIAAKKAWLGPTLASLGGSIAAVLAIVAALNLTALPAFAQVKPKPMYAGLLTVAPQDSLLGALRKASVADIQNALALAKQAAVVTPPTAASTSAGVRAACYGAILDVLNSPAGTGASNSALQQAAPQQGLAIAFTSFEHLAQVADQMQPMSQVQIACAPVAQAIRMHTLQLVLGILGGTFTLAKLGVGIP